MQSIARGITKAGMGAELVNMEYVTLEEISAVLKSSAGFVIGSPTLGGHMPTQVSFVVARTSSARIRKLCHWRPYPGWAMYSRLALQF